MNPNTTQTHTRHRLRLAGGLVPLMANRDRSIAIVNDIPSEAALTPAGWAELTFE